MTWDITENFEYVVNVKPPDPICFGSIIERDVMPMEGKGLSPFMRLLQPEVRRNVGPGKYEIKKTALSDLTSRPASKYGLGPRSIRFPEMIICYEPSLVKFADPEFKKNCAPFNSTGKRMGERDHRDNPSPSDIYPKYEKKQMNFGCSFGGKRVLRCPVRTICMPYNLDVCDACGCNCSETGDYWTYQRRISLCRKDFENLYQTALAKHKGYYLRDFVATRDCFFAHEHNSCEAALKIMTQESILKKFRKEAYLHSYFPLKRFH